MLASACAAGYDSNMVSAIRQQTTVRPGGVIEVRSPELKPGAAAEVIVLLDDAAVPSRPSGRSLVSFIGATTGQSRSVEEIDADIRALRDEWDR